MKKIKIAILCCIAILCSTSLYSQETFKPIKVVGNGMPVVTVYSSKVSLDGGYIMRMVNLNSTSGCTVIEKFDVNGNSLWHKELDYEGDLCDFIELSDGSIIGVGSPYSEFYGYSQYESYNSLCIFKLNPCGEVEWMKTDNGENYGYKYYATFNIVDVGDGLVLPIRCWIQGSVMDDFVQLTKINYGGDIVWVKRLSFPKGKGNYDLCFSNIDNEENIVFNGMAYVTPPGESSGGTSAVIGTIIVKVDKEGNLLWEACSGEDFEVYEMPWESPLVDNENNTFATIRCGWSESDYESYSISNSPIIRIDERGNAVANEIVNPDTDTSSKWSQNVGGFAWTDNKEHIVTSMRFMPAGYEGVGNKSIVKPSSNKVDKPFIYPNQKFTNATMSKSNSDDVEEYSHFINRLYVVDKNAKVVRQLDMDDYKTGELTRSILTVENDNLLVISSNVLLYEGHEYYDSHIRKYTSDLKPASIDETERNYDPFCSTGVNSGVVDLGKTTPLVYAPTAINDVVDAEKAIRVYPNPATGSVKLYLSRGIGQKIVDFYDATGRLCKSTTIGEGWAQENVDISELPSGIYFLKLTVDNKVIGNEKLIVK